MHFFLNLQAARKNTVSLPTVTITTVLQANVFGVVFNWCTLCVGLEDVKQRCYCIKYTLQISQAVVCATAVNVQYFQKSKMKDFTYPL